MLLAAAAQDEIEQDDEGQDGSSLGDQEDDDTVHVLEPVKVSRLLWSACRASCRALWQAAQAAQGMSWSLSIGQFG